jgi:hypothetical protein
MGNGILWMKINHTETVLNHVDREEEIRRNQRGHIVNDLCEKKKKINLPSIFGLENLRCNFQILS